MVVTADDACNVCLMRLTSAPVIRLSCGHVFHLKCCQGGVNADRALASHSGSAANSGCCAGLLRGRWKGARITFGFSCCPNCRKPMEHHALEEETAPIRALFEDVSGARVGVALH